MTQIERSRIVNHRRYTIANLGCGKALVALQSLLDLLAHVLACAGELARHRGLAFARHPANVGERHVFGIVTAKAKPIARLQRGNGRRQHGLHRRGEPAAVGIGWSAVWRRIELFIRERIEPLRFTQPIDKSLRHQRSEPGGEAAPAVKIPEQRSAEQLAVERVGDFARAAGAIDRIRRAIQRRTELGDEMIPGRFVAFTTGAREREVGQMQ